MRAPLRKPVRKHLAGSSPCRPPLAFDDDRDCRMGPTQTVSRSRQTRHSQRPANVRTGAGPLATTRIVKMPMVAEKPSRELDLLKIRIDDVQGAEIIELLQEHLRSMQRVSPPESMHALDLAGLRQPEITFWTVWDGTALAGCGALKELDRLHAEIKSMRTAYAYQRKGVASALLRHIVAEAQRRGYRRLLLETGSMDYFEPARKLYAAFGFARCDPFDKYVEDRNSVFM